MRDICVKPTLLPDMSKHKESHLTNNLVSLLLQAVEMIHNIREAFNELLEENEWMDDQTKSVAKEKVGILHHTF